MSRKTKPLEWFFAVTLTSVYQYQVRDGIGLAVKIAINKGATSPVEVGKELRNGTMISVGERLIAFVPEGHSLISSQTSYVRQIADVNTHWWGGQSGAIVALFTDKKAAMRCSKEKNLHPRDPRWIDSTAETLRKIGLQHPHLSVCTTPDMCLLMPSEWLRK